MKYIDEIFALDDIFLSEEKFSKAHNLPVINVSHWDSSKAFQTHMGQALVLPSQSLPWDYYYTYSMSDEDRLQVLKNLGVSSDQLTTTMGLLLQSSTIAIVNMINLLVHYGHHHLCILQPAYFSVESCCTMFSLRYNKEYISFINGQPRIPMEKIESGNYDCIWVTSPILNTGYYFDDAIIKDIARLKSRGITLIFDESLALPGHELTRIFPIDRRFFAIYSPHKAISINGFKFSVIVCDKLYEDFLDQWVDIFSGALSGSNRDAIFHYISPNYINSCYPAYIDYINKTKKSIENIVSQFPFSYMLSETKGHYINIFTNLKVKNESETIGLVNDTINATSSSFIPTTLNGFAKNQDFGFRVNLTGDNKELSGAVGRILRFLNSKR